MRVFVIEILVPLNKVIYIWLVHYNRNLIMFSDKIASRRSSYIYIYIYIYIYRNQDDDAVMFIVVRQRNIWINILLRRLCINWKFTLTGLQFTVFTDVSTCLPLASLWQQPDHPSVCDVIMNNFIIPELCFTSHLRRIL